MRDRDIPATPRIRGAPTALARSATGCQTLAVLTASP